MIRGYTNTDLVCTARVWLRSGQAEYHYLKAFQELNEKKAIDVFRCCIQDKCEIWVYETKEGIIGFMAMNASLVDRLYVDPKNCLLYTSPSPRDATLSRMPSSS